MGAKVTVIKDGPLRVEGDLSVEDGEGHAFSLEGKAVVFLCRCGHSSNAPFCDGSHNKYGFASSPSARRIL